MLKLPSASLLLISVMITACGARSAGPPAAPKASRAALAAKPIEWSKRDPAVPIWPASVSHGQLIVTGGWAQGEHYAWAISEGTDVVAVYRCTTDQLGEIIDLAGRAFRPTVSKPGDEASFVILGSFKQPPPPPPDPGGFPGPYVEQVLHAAWTANYEATALGAKQVGP